MATAADVAKLMRDQLDTKRWLDQESAVYLIERRFGKEWIYTNENGNPAIKQSVLRAFRKISEDDVVWSRSEKAWRKREKNDPPGRMVD